METQKEDPGTPHSNLCTRCSVLSFNDSEHGGYEDEAVLQFDGDEAEHRKTLTLNYKHTDTLPDLPLLRESAAAGCEFCARLRQATLDLRLEQQADLVFRLQYVYGPKYTELYEEDVGVYLLVAELFIVEAGVEVLQTSLVFTVDSTGDCRDWLQALPSPQTHVLSSENITGLTEILSDCDTSCECSGSQAAQFAPTRLLDLQDWDTDQRVRLVEITPDMISAGLRYAALSYCWGPPSDAALQLKTTRDVFKDHLVSIDSRSMTPVIRDTITLTKALSIRYVWIDALCIIQGDYEDWVRESEQMDLVYANAYFTLCPLTSSSCLQGFLEREKPLRIPFRSTVQRDVSGSYCLRYLRSIPRQYSRSVIWLETTATVWDTRGWTFQEKNLASRRIYVGRSQLHYVCTQKEWMEPSWWSFQPSDHPVQQYTKDKTKEELNDIWTELVEDYASRQLTNPADRFPALSGIAKLFAKATGDSYVAGLWSSDMLRQSLWDGHRGLTSLEDLIDSLTTHNKDHYICPSWSWAQQYVVRFPSFQPHPSKHAFRAEHRSFEASASPKDADLNPWGCLSTARLHVEAKHIIVSGTWVRVPFKGVASHFQQWRLDLGNQRVAHCGLDWDPSGANAIPAEGVTLVLLASSRDLDSDAEAAEDSDAAETDLVGLDKVPSLVSEATHHDSDEQLRARKAWGLMLFPFAGGEFVRIGMFEVGAREGGLGVFRESPFRTFDIV